MHLITFLLWVPVTEEHLRGENPARPKISKNLLIIFFCMDQV